jgi:hypothetical protein
MQAVRAGVYEDIPAEFRCGCVKVKRGQGVAPSLAPPFGLAREISHAVRTLLGRPDCRRRFAWQFSHDRVRSRARVPASSLLSAPARADQKGQAQGQRERLLQGLHQCRRQAQAVQDVLRQRRQRELQIPPPGAQTTTITINRMRRPPTRRKTRSNCRRNWRISLVLRSAGTNALPL